METKRRMNISFGETEKLRLKAKSTAKPIHFFCVAPKARSVFLAGDFNDWDRASLPMQRRPDGAWLLEAPLTHGHHLYYFLVDGEPVLDPKAMGVARNEWDEPVSVIAVS